MEKQTDSADLRCSWKRIRQFVQGRKETLQGKAAMAAMEF